MIGKKSTLLDLCFFAWILISSHHQNKMFTSLPALQTGIDFTNQLENNPDLNILSYIYYYNGGGGGVGDINNDGLTDIYFTANSNAAINYT